MSTFDELGRIDPHAGSIIVCVGKKRSGKSIMGLLLFMSYPGDRLVIDVAGDDGPVGEDVYTLKGRADELPGSWPEWLRDGDKPMTLRYVPDAGSPSFLADMDHAVGLAVGHGECALLVHEMGRLCPANRTPPNTNRVLQHGRHNGATTSIWCGPRSKGIDALLLQQADLIYTFELQQVEDRKRIAENIGWNVQDFHEKCAQLEIHEPLVFDANIPKPQPGEEDMRLQHYERLPLDVVTKVDRWAKGYRRGKPTEVPA